MGTKGDNADSTTWIGLLAEARHNRSKLLMRLNKAFDEA